MTQRKMTFVQHHRVHEAELALESLQDPCSFCYVLLSLLLQPFLAIYTTNQDFHANLTTPKPQTLQWNYC